MAKTIIQCLGVFCLIATLIPFIPSDHWTVRMFDFPHAQIASLTLIALVAGFFLFSFGEVSDIVLFVLLVGCLIYQVKIIYPYTPIAAEEVLDSDGDGEIANLKVLSSNVLMENKGVDKVIDVVMEKDPHILLLLEPNEWWQSRLLPIREKYEYYVEEPLDNKYGMMMYSKYKLIDPEVKYLVEDDIPSIHTKVQLPSGSIVQLFGVHPEPPSPTENEMSTDRDGELLIVGKMAKKINIPVIVFGDLNDVAWSKTTRLFQKISRLLDPRKGRGFYNTYNAKVPFMRWPLDHIFHSDHFKLLKIERLPHVGSDHFPIIMNLALEPEAEIEQEQPLPKEGDEEMAEEKIRKVKN